MQITYVNHACLFIETVDCKVLTDPWFAGPAYARQWHPFPKPVNTHLTKQADALLISHAHEDHLHEPTLVTLEKSMRVFYPFNWYGGIVEWLRGMGYDNITEAVSCHTYDLSARTRVTYIVNGHDSIMVLEDGEEVLVNVNDALHSYEPFIIDAFTDYIRRRWPAIDVVCCGFGGASYYPNTFHGPGKDDWEVAWLREQLFAHSFCRIVQRLTPRIAVPFAADFALLADEQRWINDVRFSKATLQRYFRTQGGTNGFAVMYSADRLVDGRLDRRSVLHNNSDPRSLSELLAEEYPERTSALLVTRSASTEELGTLRSLLETSISQQSRWYEASTLDGLAFSVQLRDAPAGCSWLNVLMQGRNASVSLGREPWNGATTVIDTTTEVLRRCLESDWGGDTIIIGYGCNVRVSRAEDLRNGRGRLCAELCVRHPRARAYARAHPLRVARFLAQTPLALTARIKERARQVVTHRRNIVNGPHWLSCGPAEIRQICDLPDWPSPSRTAIA